MNATCADGNARSGDPSGDALALQDANVLACDPSRLVIRTNVAFQSSKRGRIGLSVAAIALLTLASVAVWRFLVPGAPLLPLAAFGLGTGIFVAYNVLFETRLVATADGEGLFLERHSPFWRPKSRRLIVSYAELTGHDVRSMLDDESTPAGHVAWVLRLHAGSRRIDAWSALEPEVARAVGWRLMRLAEGARAQVGPSREQRQDDASS